MKNIVTRGGYSFKYFFNAGLNKKTGICDEEGVDVFDADTHEYLDSIGGVDVEDIEEMSESEFNKMLTDNYIC